ncbi:32838_t:CDS:1, partial [Gigaspora margarita]
ANDEQEHTFTLTKYQFGTSIPSYFEYGEESQPIQSGVFPNQ